MDAVRLRFPDPAIPDLPLPVGTHPVGHGAGGLRVGTDVPQPLLRICVDRRGIWLNVPEGAPGVHVNGRPVQRVSLLRPGDMVYVDGQELRLLGPAPVTTLPEADEIQAGTASVGARVVLRGVGGRYHGRSITLERPRLVGRVKDADIRIDDLSFADRHARLELVGDRVLLRDLGSHDGSEVNGQGVRDAVLQPGDQVVFDPQHRFVVEAPRRGLQALADPPPASIDDDADEAEDTAPVSTWRLPWVLLAAVLLAGALSALLLFGRG